MTQLSWNEIQDRATEFAADWHDKQRISSERGEAQSFWSGFLSIYGIDRRRHGAFFEYAIKKGSGKQGYIDMFWPGKLLAEQKAPGRDLEKAGIQAYEYLETMPDHDLPEAIVVSDFVTFQFIRLDTREKIEFKLEDLPRHVKLFGFLINQASKHLAEESPVNRQAAESMANLHNQLRDDHYEGHDLEVLLVRLVFCMFADDSGIFDHSILQQYLENRTSDDGSDFGPRLMQIFQALNTPVDKRQSSLDEIIASLPYVNGGLFAESIQSPNFTSAMRTTLLDAMRLDWSKVSPAIFGSMFQGVMDEKQRRNLGAHYTSEKNILRVIKPLFLDDLYAEFAIANAAGPRKKYDELRKLQDKIAGLKFLDPACGSGNFLVITYREIRKLEHKIVAILAKNNDQQDMLASAGEGIGSLKVNVDQMYGIEIEEFPSLIAQTALWLTDHQMNMEYSHQSGRMFKRLPLIKSATIVNDNALTKDWAEVIAPSELDYILGNPPFLGKKEQDKDQKALILELFDGERNAGLLDFVSGWYVKAVRYMKQNPKIQTALVSTNSITQGEQTAALWKPLLKQGVRINFGHRTFKWANDAKSNAAVYCVIVGFALFNKAEKRIFEYEDIKGEPNEVVASNINPYLIDAEDIVIENRSLPICSMPKMIEGITPLDSGILSFTEEEKRRLLEREPEAKKWIKPWITGGSFMNNEKLYCLWMSDISPSELRRLPAIMELVQQVKEFRQNSKSSQQFATTPWLFRETKIPSRYLLVPKTSSENRDYIPIGYIEDGVASSATLIVESGDSYVFGVLTSAMSMAWVRTIAGRLKSDYRYSAKLVYNNFIWPEVTETQKAEIEKLAQAILDTRAEFPNASLADLYDPLTMPPVLVKAHKTLDRAVDRLYSLKSFANDADRVALLFRLHEERFNA